VAKAYQSHLTQGEMHPGEPIAPRIDQILTQDATGTFVMLTLEAMGLDRAKTEASVQYVDHNLIEADFRNAVEKARHPDKASLPGALAR